MRADATLEAEHGLNEQRRLNQALVEKVLQIIKVRSVVALELETRATLGAGGQDVLDVLEGVVEDDPLVREVVTFPLVLEVLETFQHAEQAEVHRAHVQARELRLERCGRGRALLNW